MKVKLLVFILFSFIHQSQSKFFSDLIGFTTPNRDVELLGNGFPLRGGNRRNGVVRSGRQETGEDEEDFLFPDEELDTALIQDIFTTPEEAVEELLPEEAVEELLPEEAVEELLPEEAVEELLPVTEESQTENEDDSLETAVDPDPVPITEPSNPTTNPPTTTILPETTTLPLTTTEVLTTTTEVPTSSITFQTDTPIPTTIEADTTTTPLPLSDQITTTIQPPSITMEFTTTIPTLTTKTETVVRTISTQPTTTEPPSPQDGPRISNSRPSQDPQNSISGTDDGPESEPRIVNRPSMDSPTFNSQFPTVNNQAPSVNNQSPSVNNQSPSVNNQSPAVNTQLPAANAQPTSVNNQSPAVNNFPPTNIPANNNGPRRMKFCLPLSRPDCGLLADPSLTSGILQYIENDNIKTSSLNDYLTSQLLSSVQRIPGRSEIISLFPDDISFKRISLPSRNLVGSYGQCGNKVKLHRGGYIDGKIRLDTTDTLESGGNLFKTTPVFYQGVVGWDANLSAKLHATFYKNILISCLKKRERTQRASTRIRGSAAVGAVMNARDFQLDYINKNKAELSFIFDLGLKAKLLGVESGSVNIQGCRFSSGLSQVSACGQFGDVISSQLRSMAQNPFFVQGSTPLFKEIENLVGARKGERVVLVLQRNPVGPPAAPPVPELDISGLGRVLPSAKSPRRLSLLPRL